MKARRILAAWAIWSLALATVTSAPDWENLVLKEVNFRDVPLEEACRWIVGEVNRRQSSVCVEVKVNIVPPDPRCSSIATSVNRRVTLLLRNVPSAQVLRYLEGLTDIRINISSNAVTLADRRRGWIYTAPQSVTDMQPGAYGNFDRRVKIVGRTNRVCVAHVLASVAEATETGIVCQPPLESAAFETEVRFADGEWPAFWLLKASVEALRKATQKEVILYKPPEMGMLTSGCDFTGSLLGIMCKPDRFVDVRGFFPLFKPTGTSTNMVVPWSPTDDEATFQQMLKDSIAHDIFWKVFYEPQMNCFWLIGNKEWSHDLPSTWFQVIRRESRRSYDIQINSNAEIKVMEPKTKP
jgi:hypothetical protein